ncbi:hypothetical protein KC362_g74 [Hortaea werneckii]|nr:hypothetical protein KC362_g74 [Hortaea werneckii]
MAHSTLDLIDIVRDEDVAFLYRIDLASGELMIPDLQELADEASKLANKHLAFWSTRDDAIRVGTVVMSWTSFLASSCFSSVVLSAIVLPKLLLKVGIWLSGIGEMQILPTLSMTASNPGWINVLEILRGALCLELQWSFGRSLQTPVASVHQLSRHEGSQGLATHRHLLLSTSLRQVFCGQGDRQLERLAFVADSVIVASHLRRKASNSLRRSMPGAAAYGKVRSIELTVRTHRPCTSKGHHSKITWVVSTLDRHKAECAVNGFIRKINDSLGRFENRLAHDLCQSADSASCCVHHAGPGLAPEDSGPTRRVSVRGSKKARLPPPAPIVRTSTEADRTVMSPTTVSRLSSGWLLAIRATSVEVPPMSSVIFLVCGHSSLQVLPHCSSQQSPYAHTLQAPEGPRGTMTLPHPAALPLRPRLLASRARQIPTIPSSKLPYPPVELLARLPRSALHVFVPFCDDQCCWDAFAFEQGVGCYSTSMVKGIELSSEALLCLDDGTPEDPSFGGEGAGIRESATDIYTQTMKRVTNEIPRTLPDAGDLSSEPWREGRDEMLLHQLTKHILPALASRRLLSVGGSRALSSALLASSASQMIPASSTRGRLGPDLLQYAVAGERSFTSITILTRDPDHLTRTLVSGALDSTSRERLSMCDLR